jgi:hypothetical protein
MSTGPSAEQIDCLATAHHLWRREVVPAIQRAVAELIVKGR